VISAAMLALLTPPPMARRRSVAELVPMAELTSSTVAGTLSPTYARARESAAGSSRIADPSAARSRSSHSPCLLTAPSRLINLIQLSRPTDRVTPTTDPPRRYMGGKVAQLLASRRPDGLPGLVLVAPAPATPPVIPQVSTANSHGDALHRTGSAMAPCRAPWRSRRSCPEEARCAPRACEPAERCSVRGLAR
jgi:hypothetical protein